MAIVNNILKNDLYKDSIIPKALKKGMKIRIKHYSTFEPLINIVRNVQGNIVTMDLPQKLLDNNILTGDNIVCIFLHEDVEYVLNGEVMEITLLFPQKLMLKVENVEKYTNLRKQARYSVSLSSNVRKLDSKSAYFAVVKNISLLGVSFTCNTEFEVNGSIIINIAVSKDTVITFYGRIIRVRKLSNFYEYGLIQTNIDEFNRDELEKYIQKLKEEEDSLFAEEIDE